MSGQPEAPQDAQPQQAAVKKKKKSAKGLIVGTALVLVLGTICGITVAGQNNTLAEQDSQVAQLESELQAERRISIEAASKDLSEDLGISSTRVLQDDPMLRELLLTAFSWSSGEDYEKARERLISRYKIQEDSRFLTDFLPPSKFNEDMKGQRSYWLDTVGLNAGIDVKNADIEVASVDGTTYEYLVMGTIDYSSDFTDSTNENGTVGAAPTSGRRVLLEVSVDGDGNVMSLEGVPASGQTRRSN